MIAVEKTTVSQAWITEHLGMKNADDASRPIHLMVLSLSEKKVSEKLTSSLSDLENSTS
jgi:hypothetical protein